MNEQRKPTEAELQSWEKMLGEWYIGKLPELLSFTLNHAIRSASDLTLWQELNARGLDPEATDLMRSAYEIAIAAKARDDKRRRGERCLQILHKEIPLLLEECAEKAWGLGTEKAESDSLFQDSPWYEDAQAFSDGTEYAPCDLIKETLANLNLLSGFVEPELRADAAEPIKSRAFPAAAMAITIECIVLTVYPESETRDTGIQAEIADALVNPAFAAELGIDCKRPGKSLRNCLRKKKSEVVASMLAEKSPGSPEHQLRLAIEQSPFAPGLAILLQRALDRRESRQ